MSAIRGLASVFVCSAALCYVPRQVAAQQQPVAEYLAAARRQLDALNPDSAGSLLVRVLDLRARVTREERVRALVLLGIAELMLSDPDKARLSFQQALALDPQLRVDSLADLQTFVLTTFDAARLSAARNAEPRPATLEILNAPAFAEVRVDGTRWEVRRDTVRPGLHRIQVLASGYLPFVDSVMVDSGSTVLREVGVLHPIPVALPQNRPAVPSERQQAGPPAPPVVAAAAHREGSVEMSIGAGGFLADQRMMRFLDDRGVADPGSGRLMLGGALRLGYNLDERMGVSLGTGYSTGRGATAFTPFAAFTYTMDINRNTAPFITAGVGLPSIGGSDGLSGFGAHLGVGVRSMIGERLAARVEYRMHADHFSALGDDAAWTALNGTGSMAYNSQVAVGLSYFFGGRLPLRSR